MFMMMMMIWIRIPSDRQWRIQAWRSVVLSPLPASLPPQKKTDVSSLQSSKLAVAHLTQSFPWIGTIQCRHFAWIGWDWDLEIGPTHNYDLASGIVLKGGGTLDGVRSSERLANRKPPDSVTKLALRPDDRRPSGPIQTAHGVLPVSGDWT